MRAVSLVVAVLLLGSSGVLGFPGTGMAEDKAVVLNSNAALKRYADVQDGILETMEGIKTVDLETKRLDGRQMEDFLIGESPDVVFSIGGKAMQSASVALPTGKKMVFTSVINWQRFRLGDDMYGVANEVPPLAQLTLYRELFPNIHNIGIIYSREYNAEWFNLANQRAEEMNLHLIGRNVHYAHEVLNTLKELLPQVDAVWVTADPVVLGTAEITQAFFQASDAQKKPVFAYSAAFNSLGATVTLSPDEVTVGRQAALLGRVALSGKTMTDHVQPPAGTFITLNMAKVKKYGIPFNMDSLNLINEIIEH